MNTDTPTPRTDAAILRGPQALLDDVVYAQFARVLELDLAAVTKERDELATANKGLTQQLADAWFNGSIAEQERDEAKEQAERWRTEAQYTYESCGIKAEADLAADARNASTLNRRKQN